MHCLIWGEPELTGVVGSFVVNTLDGMCNDRDDREMQPGLIVSLWLIQQLIYHAGYRCGVCSFAVTGPRAARPVSLLLTRH